MRLRDDPQTVGDAIREALGVPVSTQFAWRRFEAFRGWRKAVERLGVLVCQFPGKGIGELRGTSILHFPLPVIGINSKGTSAFKTFHATARAGFLFIWTGYENRSLRQIR